MRPCLRPVVLAVALTVASVALPVIPPGAAWSGPTAAGATTYDPDSTDGVLYRFYRGFLLREPDRTGYRNWHCLIDKGRASLATVADSFVGSDEFRSRYGTPSDTRFLDIAYGNLFDRTPDDGGRAYWLDRMARGLSQGRVMAALSDSAEFKSRTADGRPPELDPNTSRATTCGEVLLAWIAEGLPPGFSSELTRADGVTASTIVHGDLVKLTSTRDRNGTIVETAPTGWAWPIDGLAIDPASYAQFRNGRARDVLAALQPGQVVLTESSARVRRIGVGGTLGFGSVTVAVVGIVDDRNGSAGEVIFHRTDAPRVGIDTERFMLVRDTDRPAVEAAARRATPRGKYLSLKGDADTTWMRHADRVDPQTHVKLAFGEFLFQDASGREVRIDPAWVNANIATETVPLLGTIRCHRAVLPRVRAAMQALVDSGNGRSVDRSAYAGCQYARRILPGQGLSRHTWGLALDLNISGNPRGDYETQHPALVAAMRGNGFHWGGDWEYPDPGHYEAMS